MGDLFQPTHLMVIAIVLLVMFGGRRLPELGKGLGEALSGFKEGLRGTEEPTVTHTSSSQTETRSPASGA